MYWWKAVFSWVHNGVARVRIVESFWKWHFERAAREDADAHGWERAYLKGVPDDADLEWTVEKDKVQ